MAFLGKLGNVLEDAASFAVPAGLFALGTFAGGGNPLAGKALMGAAASGAGGFARNEEEERIRKAQEEARRSSAVANLMNAISPGTGARGAAPVMPKAGLMETVARGGAQGYDFYKKAEMAANAAKEMKNRLKAQEDAELARQGKVEAFSTNALEAGTTVPVLTSENRGGGPTPEIRTDVPMVQFAQDFGEEALEGITPVVAAQREYELEIEKQRADIDRIKAAGGGGGGSDWGKMQPRDIAADIGVMLALDPTLIDPADIQATANSHFVKANLGDKADALMPAVLTSLAEHRDAIAVRRSTYLLDAVDAAIAEARTQDDVAGINLFNNKMENSPYAFSADTLKNEAAMIRRAAQTKNLSEEQARLMGGLIGLDHNLLRVQKTVSGMEDKAFEFISAKAREILSDSAGQRLVPPEFVGLMAQLGYTAEMSARIFSGAALSEYDERIYRNIFIGNASAGRANMLASLKEFRAGNRDRMMGVLLAEKFERGAFDIAGSVLPDGSIATGEFDIALPEGLLGVPFGLDALDALNLGNTPIADPTGVMRNLVPM